MLGVWTDSLDHLVHLLVAFVLDLPIGWNRGRVERGAGLRTYPLVAMASCGFVQTRSQCWEPRSSIKQTSYRASSPASVSSARQSAMPITISGSYWRPPTLPF